MAGKSEVARAAGVLPSAVDQVFGSILHMIRTGQEVRISGFGTFSKAHREGRKGRNPATGEDLMIEAKDVLKFKATKDIDLSLPKPTTTRRR